MKSLALLLAALPLAAFSLQGPAPGKAVPPADAVRLPGAAQAVIGERPRVRTLWQEDFIRHAIALDTGAYGLTVQDFQVVNVGSELDFGAYYPDQLLAGVQGAEVGDLLDLGTGDDLAARYGYQETVGGGQGFSSIRFEDGGLVILADYATGETQPFTEGQVFLDGPPPASSVPAPVQVGHVYLVRILDLLDPSFLRFAKLLVTGHTANESVTVAWQELVPD